MERGWNDLWCVGGDSRVRLGGEMVKNGGRDDGWDRRPLVLNLSLSSRGRVITLSAEEVRCGARFVAEQDEEDLVNARGVLLGLLEVAEVAVLYG
jgi:hypothetical protein